VEVFSKQGVRSGRIKLLATATALAALAVVGELMRGETRVLNQDLGAIIYAVGLAGLVGFGTNWLAIRMLFHPRLPVLGIQGVVPKKREEIADRASALMEERLISGDRLGAWIAKQGGLSEASSFIRERLPKMLTSDEARSTLLNAAGGFIQDAIPPLMLRLREIVLKQVNERMGAMAGMVQPMIESMMEPVEERVREYVADPENLRETFEKSGARVDAAVQQLADRLAESGEIERELESSLQGLLARVRVADLIREEILKQDDAELEALVNDAASDQLVFLQIAGGILGMLAGLVLIWPWLAAPFAALIGMGGLLSAKADRKASALRTLLAASNPSEESESKP